MLVYVAILRLFLVTSCSAHGVGCLMKMHALRVCLVFLCGLTSVSLFSSRCSWRSITSMEYPPLLCGAASDGFPSLSSPSSLSSVSCCEGEGVGVCVSLLPLPTGHTVCGPSSPRRVCASPASIRSASTHCVRGSGKEGEAVCTAPSSAITDLFCALPVSNATSTASGSTRALSNSARNDNTSPTPTLIQTSTTLPGEHPPTLDARLLITSTASANPQSESADNVYLLSLARGSRVGFLGTGYQLFSAVKPGEYAPRPWLASVFPTAFRVEDYKVRACVHVCVHVCARVCACVCACVFVFPISCLS